MTTSSLASIQVKNIDSPDAQRRTDQGVLDIVEMAGATIVRATLQPGWKWSVDIKPQAGTDTCKVPHVGIVLSGRFAVRADDGTEVEMGPGDAHVVAPGHDAWVVGDHACVLLDVAATA